MIIPIIERIKQTATIDRVIKHYGIELHHAGGGNLRGICPFHDDHKPSLMVSPKKNICKCFVCGDKAMDPIAFVMRMERCNYPEALQHIGAMVGIDTHIYIRSDGRLQSITPKPQFIKPAPSYITENEVNMSLDFYDINPLYNFMGRHFGLEATDRAFGLYRVGTSHYWRGSPIFWQTDAQGHTRTGKVMAYDPETGHRLKAVNGERSFMAWMHTKRHNFLLQQCLFGEHLISAGCDTVNVVESEKTALIAYLHFSGLWVATGGKSNVSSLLRARSLLRTRPVMLWPDADAVDSWLQLARRLSDNGWWDVRVNPAAQRLAPGTKSDIADIILLSD